MRHIWLIAFLLVGCTAKTDAPEEVPEAGDPGIDVGETNGPIDEPASQAQIFTGALEVTITNAEASGSEASTGSTNCAGLEVSGEVAIVGGNITGTWTAQGPQNDELQIRTAVRNGIHRGAADYQSSPATWEVPSIEAWSDEPFVIGLFLSDPGAAADLRISIEYELEATGMFATDVRYSDCDI